ncbi:hypothetical protein CHISP_3357 [Chitinispirillum alkaliphilum]|nr:hypothetical protein CHISP_3357 [Chitinispirillum alkaliphilum]
MNIKHYFSACVFRLFLLACVYGTAGAFANSNSQINHNSEQGVAVESCPETTTHKAPSLILCESGIQNPDHMQTFESKRVGAGNNGREKDLYSGISLQQDRLAREMVQRVSLFDWDGAERIALSMQSLEKQDSLPPLSYLLLVSMKIFQVQNNEYPDQEGRKELLWEIDSLGTIGIELCAASESPDSHHAVNLLISGGIQGFRATLTMDESLIRSAREGLRALRLLEQLIETEPSVKDGYLGLGIFYCALSKAPYLVRAALSLSGRSVSLSRGLDYLRKASSEGHYTNDIARLYLIQFLDPYYGHLAREKREIFEYFETHYPQNPYYAFLELDEYLSFHRERLATLSVSEHYGERIRRFEIINHGTLKYSTLVRYQYRLINPFPPGDLEPDVDVDLREFSYYPYFLQALSEKITLGLTGADDPEYRKRRTFIKRKGQKAINKLQRSEMGPGRRGFYTWHIRDALGL